MNKKNVITGISEIEAVQIVFIILKLCGLIKWNWFWVLSPTIFYIGFLILLFIIVIIVTIIKNK